MNAVLLIATVLFMSMQTFGLKFTGTKTLRENLLVNAVFTGLIGIGFAVWLVVSKIEILQPTFWYGSLFGVMFIFTIVVYYLAMQNGPLSYTSFYFAASMLVPTAAGILFWKEALTVSVVVGTLLFLAAFFLINVFGGAKGKKAGLRWFLYCVMSFLLNGSLSLIIRMQQDAVGGTEQCSIMTIGFISACLFAFLMYLLLLFFQKGEGAAKRVRADGALIKKIPLPILGVGLGTAFTNLLITVLINRIPSSYLFPIANGGNMLLITFLSTFLFHEKLTWQGKVGIGIGLLAIVVINL